MGGLKTTTLVGIAIILAIVSALMLSFIQNSKQERLYTITNFDECVAAGYPIMESDPPQCATPDGRIFISGSQVHLLPPVSSENGNSTICVVAGCSGQLCVSAEEAETSLPHANTVPSMHAMKTQYASLKPTTRAAGQ